MEKHGDDEIKVWRTESGDLMMQLPGGSEPCKYDGRFGSLCDLRAGKDLIYPATKD